MKNVVSKQMNGNLEHIQKGRLLSSYKKMEITKFAGEIVEFRMCNAYWGVPILEKTKNIVFPMQSLACNVCIYI